MLRKTARMLIRWAATVWAEVQEELATGRAEAAWKKVNPSGMVLANQHAMRAWEEVRIASKAWSDAKGVAEADAARVRKEAWAQTAEAWDRVLKTTPGQEHDACVIGKQLETHAIALTTTDEKIWPSS